MVVVADQGELLQLISSLLFGTNDLLGPLWNKLGWCCGIEAREVFLAFDLFGNSTVILFHNCRHF